VSVEPAKESRVSISALCSHMGMSRQNYYAARRLRQHAAFPVGVKTLTRTLNRDP